MGTPPPRLLGTSGTARRALFPKGPCGRDPLNAPRAGRALHRAPTCKPTWDSAPVSVPPNEDGLGDTSLLIKHQQTLTSAHTSAPSAPSADLLQHQWAHMGACCRTGDTSSPRLCNAMGAWRHWGPSSSTTAPWKCGFVCDGEGKGDTHERGRVLSHTASKRTRGG